MTRHVTALAKDDLGLALGAIRLGGRTVTVTSLSSGYVAIAYVAHDGRTRPARRHTVEV